MERTDLRVIRTKKAIRQALAELMSMKPLEAITVSDVAAQALINRKPSMPTIPACMKSSPRWRMKSSRP